MSGRREFLFSLALGLLVVLFAGLDPFLDYDVFWHARQGQDLLQGLSPTVDRYSFTMAGQPSGASVPFAVLLALFLAVFGQPLGFFVLRLVLFGALTSSVVWLARRERSPLSVTLMLVCWLGALFSIRIGLRPELVSLTLAAVALHLVVRFRAAYDRRVALGIAVLLTVWANIHSPTLGYFVVGGLYLNWLIAARREPRRLVEICVVGLLSLATGFLNPALAHELVGVVGMDPFWTQTIGEYRPVFDRLGTPTVWLTLAGLAVALALALRRREFGLFAITAVFTLSVFRAQRMLLPAGFVAMHVVLVCVQAESLLALNERTRRLMGVAVALLALVFGVELVRGARPNWPPFRESNLRYPVELVADLEARGLEARVFNEYALGGYVLFHLAPKVKVYIDGRTAILYPPSLGRRYLEALRIDEAFAEEVKTWNIDAAVVSREEREAATVSRSRSFELDTLSPHFFFLRRTGARYPALSRVLLTPECPRDVDWAAVQLELDRLDPVSRDGLGPLEAGLRALAANETLTDFPNDDARRMAAGRALLRGDHAAVVELLGGCENPRALDLLTLVAELSALGRHDEAALALQVARQRQPNLATLYPREVQAAEAVLRDRTPREVHPCPPWPSAAQ